MLNMWKPKVERIGEENYNFQGCLMKIIEYKKGSDITIEFQDSFKFKKKTQYNNFLEGKIKNPYYKSVYNIGCIGNTSANINGLHKQSYIIWKGILKRCYVDNSYCYKDCSVCNEWLCYENFEKWYDENYYKVGEERMCLDKDILVKGNKVYSPDTCVFVPQRINTLFVKSKSKRGLCPIGVTKVKNGKYSAGTTSIGIGMLGVFSTPEKAFQVYKIKKEQYIKEIANQYKDKIPLKLYEAMYNYQVEITD